MTERANEPLFDALRRDVADFPDGEISVESKEIAALLAAYDDARSTRWACEPTEWDFGDVYGGPWDVFREPRDEHRFAIKSGHFTILTAGDYFDGGGPFEERLQWICDRVNASLGFRPGKTKSRPRKDGSRAAARG